MSKQNQSGTISFLSSVNAFADDTVHVGRETTHVSELFIGKDRVFKLKRAVKYPYLDFSTVKRRQAYCAAEVRINRRTAPDLYLGIKPISRDDNGDYHIGNKGEIVDWVVEMARFDDQSLLDKLSEIGRAHV